MSDHVWPEDQGTNSNLDRLNSGDFDDAANHASALHKPNCTDFVVSGLSVSYDATTEEMSVTDGKAYISDDTANGAQSGATRSHVRYDVQPDPKTRGVEGGRRNYVYLTIPLNGNDDISYHIDLDDTPPSTPSLKIAEVLADIVIQSGETRTDSSIETVTTVENSGISEVSA